MIGNTTSSHLKGAKENAYGELERVRVSTTEFKSILKSNDLLKIDVEGHEAEILCSTDEADWSKSDAFVEIGSDKNAEEIFKKFIGSKVNKFAQKTGWKRVKEYDSMPKSYKDGSLFITTKEKMKWK